MLCGLVLAAAVGSAWAQEVPSSVRPGQLERRFQQPLQPRAEPEPVVPGPAEQLPAEDAEKIRFVLTGVVIDGVTVYTPEQMRPAYEKLLNTEVSLADLYAVAGQLTAQYRRDGYILSRVIVPAQRISAGVVHLQAVEGYIDKVLIEGAASSGTDLIAAYGRKIVAARPVTAAALERYLLLADDLPGITATAVLESSATEQGASTLTFLIEEDRVAGRVKADNRGSRYVGPAQFEAFADVNSVLVDHNRTRFRGIATAEFNELSIVEVEHEEQIGTEGTRLILKLTRTNSKPGHTLDNLKVDSVSTAGEATLSHPFVRSRPANLSGRLVLSARNAETRVLGSDFSEDRLRVVRAGMTYDFVDQWRGISLVDLELSKGLDILNATETGSPNLSRAKGRSDFFKAAATVSRLQALPSDFSLLVSLTGQYSGSALLVSEEFSVGGADFGRAYDPSEISGDRGAAALVELRYDADLGPEGPAALQFYGFYDIGGVWNEDPDTDEPFRKSLASAGAGMRVNITESLYGDLQVAVPLTRDVEAMGTKGDDPRIFAEFSVTF